MSWILCIDTATSVCSVALAEGCQLMSLEESMEKRAHAANLTIFIDRVLKENKLAAAQLNAVAVSQGPGSYTGLRIGVSVAKGIAYGSNIPLIAIDTLRSMARGILIHPALQSVRGIALENTWFAPMIDARRMEVYTAFFDHRNHPLTDTCALVVHEDTFLDVLSERPVIFFGDGAGKCRSHLRHPNAHFIDTFTPSAYHMVSLACKAYDEKKFVDTAYFEPFYLKDFIATVPRKNIFH
jgi:tRNA threonylcarbamoyladenosine biosynthesis protein TsaB